MDNAETLKQSKEILESPLFQSVFEDMKADLMKAWAVTPDEDTQGRESLYRHYKLIGAVKTRIEKAFYSAEAALRMEALKVEELDII
jgi:hypothetical protein